MKNYPGVSRFVVRYVVRRGPRKGRRLSYPYYKARIMINGCTRFLGHYQTAAEAAAVYAKAKAERDHAAH